MYARLGRYASYLLKIFLVPRASGYCICICMYGESMESLPDGQYRIDDGITFNEVWAEMEKVLESGKVKAIGVSNFSVKNLEKLLSTAKVVPALNQVECVRSTLLDIV